MMKCYLNSVSSLRRSRFFAQHRTQSVLYSAFMWLSGIVLFASCLNFNDATQAVTLEVHVQQPDIFTKTSQHAERAVVLVSNGDTLRAYTDEQGKARFSQLTPGIYNISTAWSLSADDYHRATGEEVAGNDYLVGGSLSAQVVDATRNHLVLTTHVAQVPTLVVSKVYASGSKDANNRNYSAGKFVEFFNNSDSPIRLSDFGFGLLESSSTPAYPLGTTPNYLYLKQAFRFPNDGRMLAPGASVLVVNSAINHRNNKAPQEYDLSAADYEVKDTQGRTVNNPATPPAELIFTSWPQISVMNLVQGGPTSIVIFRTNDIATWTKVYANGKSSGQEFLRIPMTEVLDGLDIIKFSPTNGVDLSSKRLYPSIDAGYTHISSASGWNGEVTYRRAIPASANQIRIKLQDANNSASDCATASSLEPGRFIQ